MGRVQTSEQLAPSQGGSDGMSAGQSVEQPAGPKFVLHAELNADAVQDGLGRPDYSYYFVMAGYLAALDALGTAVVVSDPAQADDIYDSCSARGEACVFLSFAPPQKTPSGLRCPTVCVFAWEFSNIPAEQLDDDPRSDWRTVFAEHGRAITLSSHAARTLRAEMGDDFPVSVVAVPLWERFAGIPRRTPGAAQAIAIRGRVFDSREFGKPGFERPPYPPPAAAVLIVPAVATPEPPPAAEPVPVAELAPAAEPAPVIPARLGAVRRLRLSTRLTRHYGLLWYREAVRDMLLPRPVKRAVSVAGRSYAVLRKLRRPASPPPTILEQRVLEQPLLELPIVEQRVEPPQAAAIPPPRLLPPPQDVTLDGVVFTAVLNPADGRKNWPDILTAFCYAFRDTPDATLVLKMVHHDREAFAPVLAALLGKLLPFRCRVVTLQGWLDDADYRALIAATDFTVNASSCEGLCLPLMEFMSAGRPALAPDHTAMADYIDPANSFVLRNGLEHNVWPQDPRDLFRTMRHRLEWDSLLDAFRDSYAVATGDRARYAAMADAASDAMRRTCSLPVVRAQLAAFLAVPATLLAVPAEP